LHIEHLSSSNFADVGEASRAGYSIGDENVVGLALTLLETDARVSRNICHRLQHDISSVVYYKIKTDL